MFVVIAAGLFYNNILSVHVYKGVLLMQKPVRVVELSPLTAADTLLQEGYLPRRTLLVEGRELWDGHQPSWSLQRINNLMAWCNPADVFDIAVFARSYSYNKVAHGGFWNAWERWAQENDRQVRLQFAHRPERYAGYVLGPPRLLGTVTIYSSEFYHIWKNDPLPILENIGLGPVRAGLPRPNMALLQAFEEQAVMPLCEGYDGEVLFICSKEPRRFRLRQTE